MFKNRKRGIRNKKKLIENKKKRMKMRNKDNGKKIMKKRETIREIEKKGKTNHHSTKLLEPFLQVC